MEFVRERSPTNFAIVNFSGRAYAKHTQRDRYGHSYFRDAPTVSSDLVLLLRGDLDPGTTRAGHWSLLVCAFGECQPVIRWRMRPNKVIKEKHTAGFQLLARSPTD